MKRILYPAILVGTVLLGGFLAYTIWKAAPQTAQGYLDSGKKYYEQKKYSEAAIQLLNAIRTDPRHREALLFLAQIYVDQHDVNSAARQLTALLEYYPNDVQGNLKLGDIYVKSGDSKYYRDARNIADKILVKEPQNVDALILSGNAQAGLMEYGSSIELFDKALTLDARNIDALTGLANTYVLQKNYAEAEQLFLRAHSVDPKNKTALLKLADFYWTARKQQDKAESVFKEAFAEYPSDLTVYVPTSQFYYQSGRFEEVVKVLRKAQDLSPQEYAPGVTLLDLYINDNRLSEAQNYVVELKQKFPNSLEVAIRMARVFVERQPDKARKEIDQILKTDPKSPVGSVLLGELNFFTGKYQEAESILGQTPAINSSYPEAHFFLGRIAASRGQLDQALDHYQKSLALVPQYWPARMGLADVFLRKGRLSDSREEARRVLESQPNHPGARLLIATVDTVDKKYAEAETELKALVAENPNNAQVHRQMGVYYQSRGLQKDAEKSFIRAAELDPESENIFSVLTEFYITQKQTDLAIQRIQSVPENKKKAFHYELLGKAYSRSGKMQEAEMAYKEAIQKDPERKTAGVYLAGQYIQTGRLDDGLKELDKLIKSDPSNASLLTAKAMITQAQGKMDTAKETYAEALKVDPTSAAAANNLAFALAEEGRDLQTALQWAQTARKKDGQDPNIADTLGWIHYKLGNHILARDQVQFAISKQPDNPEFLYHLGLIYKETKQINEAEKTLKKALGSKTEFKERSLAQSALDEIVKLKVAGRVRS